MSEAAAVGTFWFAWAVISGILFFEVLVNNPHSSIASWFRRGAGDRFSKGLEDALDSMLDRRVAEWRDDLRAFRDVDKLRAQRNDLQDQVDVLSKKMAVARDDIERERQEIEFDLGLEKRRQAQDHDFAQEELGGQRKSLEAEKDLAVRSARIEAREEALKVAAEQNTEFLDRQEKMIETLVAALPKAEILAKLTSG